MIYIKENYSDSTCKGLYFRASESSYLSSHRSVESRKSLRLLKRHSCSGCSECEWLWDLITEDVNAADLLRDISHGYIYTIEVDSSQGYYDDYPEVDSIEFVKINL